ncbi:MAG: hypothetical protein ABI663_08475 [Chryseolinea sp.]
MKRILLIVAISCYLFSCNDNEEKLVITSFGNCSGGILTDSLSIHTQLIGTWTWTERHCPCCSDAKPTLADKYVTATFNSNSTFTVLENSTSVITGTWEVQKNLNDYVVSINKEGTGIYLNGSISICENQLLADMSPVDGCKHLFIKAK